MHQRSNFSAIGGKALFALALATGLCLQPRPAAAQTTLPLTWYASQITTPNSVAISPDCTWVAAGDGGGIHLYSLAGSGTRYLPTTATGGVSSIAFSPDGKTFVDCGKNASGGVLETWNLATGTLIQSLPTSANNGNPSVAFSPDGTTVAVGGQNNNPTTGVILPVLELWNVSTGKLLGTLNSSTFGINSVAFSPDGKTLVDGGNGDVAGVVSGVIELWNVSTGNAITTLPTGTFDVASVAFSPDGTSIADGGYAFSDADIVGEVETWSASGFGALGSAISGASEGGPYVAYSPSGKSLLVGGYGPTGGVLEMRSAATCALQSTLTTALTGINSVAFGSNGTTIVDGGPNAQGGALEYIEQTGNNGTFTALEQGPAITATNTLAFSTDGSTLYQAGFEYFKSQDMPVLQAWNAKTGQQVPIVGLGSAISGIQSIALSPDGTTLAIGGYFSSATSVSGVLQLYNVKTKALLFTLNTASSLGVNSVAFSPDGKTLAAGGNGIASGVVELWGVSTGNLLASLNTSAADGIFSVAFSPDGKTLVDGGQGSSNGVLEVWTVSSATLVGALTTKAESVQSVSFSPDGKSLLAGGFNATSGLLEIWNLGNTSLTASLTPDPGTQIVNSATFTPAGTAILAATDTGLQAFSVSTGAVMQHYAIGSVNTLAFSGDGSGLALSQGNGAFAVAPNPLQDFVGVSALTINPTSVVGGNNATATVTLAGKAAAAGVVVSLSSSNAAATVPTSVTIAGGATTTTFTVATNGVNNSTAVTITAATLAGSQTGTLTVTPATSATITLSPNTVVGGNTSTGTVKLNALAGPTGVSIPLSSSSTSAQVPSFVTIAAGQSSGTFTVHTSGVTASATAIIKETFNKVTQSATLTITPPSIASITLNPTSLLGGTKATGTVTLTGAAAPKGTPVTLSSNNSCASVPKTVTVLSGQTTATFTVATVGVSAQKVATISATTQKLVKTATLTVNPPSLASVSLSLTTVFGGTSSVGMVVLSSPAGSSGVAVKLSSSLTNATVPASVTIGNTKTSATFTVKTTAVPTQKTATITASLNGVSKTATLTINAPGLVSLVLSPTSLVGGASSTGTVTLSSAVGTGGISVSLSSSSRSATVPATVLVPAGKASAKFTVKTVAVATQTIATLTATLGASSKTAQLTINAPTLTGLKLSPTSVKGGKSGTGTVSISSVAPVGGLVISLSGSGSSAAKVPGSVTVAAGKTSGTFTVTTTTVTASTSTTVKATLGSISKTANLTITH